MNFLLKKISKEETYIYFSINIFFLSFLFILFRSLLDTSETSDLVIFTCILLSNEIIYLALSYKLFNFKLDNFYNIAAILITIILCFFLWIDNSIFFLSFVNFIFYSSIIFFFYNFYFKKKFFLFKKDCIDQLIILLFFFGLFLYIKQNFIFSLILNISIIFFFFLFQSYKNKYFKFLDYFIASIIFLTFFKVFLLSSIKDEFHYSWYLGPINSIINGGVLLKDTVSQYGFLNLEIIKFFSNLINLKTELTLVIFIVFFLVIFFFLFYRNLLNELNLPRFFLIIFISFLVFANFSFSGVNGATFIPSSSVFRFLPSIIFFLYLNKFELSKINKIENLIFLNFFLLISLLWSFESFVFTIFSSFGSLFFCLFFNFKQSKIFFKKKFFFFIFINFLVLVLFSYNKEILFFYEYSFNFISSSSAIQFSMNSYELVFFSFFCFIYLIWRDSLEFKDLEITFKNTVWFLLSISISTYFLIRSHPNNLFNILPFLTFCIIQIKNKNEIKKTFLFYLIFSSIFVSISYLSNSIHDFKKMFFSKTFLELPSYKQINLDQDILNIIDKYPNVPVTVVSGKTIHNPINEINSKGYGMPILPLEQFNILNINRKIEIYKKIFKNNKKNLLICIGTCNFYNEENVRKSWNDIFLPTNLVKKNILFTKKNEDRVISIYILDRINPL